jgi:aldose 1-epimerase
MSAFELMKRVCLVIETPVVSLHGGPTGFASLPFTLLSSPQTESNLFTRAELSHLINSPSLSSPTATSYALFRHVSPDGDQGYPGTLTVEVLVALLEPPKQERKYQRPGESKPVMEPSKLGSLVYVYRAKVDKGVTPINLTQVRTTSLAYFLLSVSFRAR